MSVNRYLYEVLIGMVQDLNEGNIYRCTKMSRRHVFRVVKISKNENDGWSIVNKLKHMFNEVYLKSPISDETFYSLPVHVYGKCVEIDDHCA